MWIVIILVAIGFVAGYFMPVPFDILGTKYLALLFLALLDSFTFSLGRDLAGERGNSTATAIRFIVGLLVAGFIIYYGEKSQLDLYFIALIPLAVGFAINMYKFLPK